MSVIDRIEKSIHYRILIVLVAVVALPTSYWGWKSYVDGATSQNVDDANGEIKKDVKDVGRDVIARIDQNTVAVLDRINQNIKISETALTEIYREKEIYKEKFSHDRRVMDNVTKIKSDTIAGDVETSKISIQLYSSREHFELNMAIKQELMSRFFGRGYAVSTGSDVCERCEYKFTIFARLDMPSGYIGAPPPASVSLDMIPKTERAKSIDLPRQIRTAIPIEPSERPDMPGVIMRASNQIMAQLAEKIPPYKP